jgi:hypothetical protein
VADEAIQGGLCAGKRLWIATYPSGVRNDDLKVCCAHFTGLSFGMAVSFRFGAFALAILTAASLAACQPRGEQEEPIFASVRQNDAEALSIYLESGGDPNAVNRTGDPLVYVATGPRGGAEALMLLLDAGADPDAKSAEGRTLLQNAASWCDEEIVTLLLGGGANPNLPGMDGAKPADAVCTSPLDRREATLALIEAAAGNPG